MLRFRLTTMGDTAYFGNDTRGTVTWNYELARINRPLTIELPVTCPQSLGDTPILTDASQVERDPAALK